MISQHTGATRTTSRRDGARIVALLFVGLRRVRFMARFIYWAVRHKTTKHAAWTCHYEGYRW